jgi:hypothetical protein
MGTAEAAADHRAIEGFYRREAAKHAAQAAQFEAGHRGEAEVTAALDGAGMVYLQQRRWPRTRNGDIDFIVVHASGVWVIDAKAWKEPRLEGSQLFRGQDDETEALTDSLRQAVDVEQSLVDLGLPPLEVHPVLAFAFDPGMRFAVGRVHLIDVGALARLIDSRGERLSKTRRAAIYERLQAAFPPYRERTAVPIRRPSPRPKPRAATYEQLCAFDSSQLDLEALRAACALPLQPWMTWLDPRQAPLVGRHWSGPSRIRGPAGTGKTVLGLHRAAYLTEHHPGKLLFTSYVRTLPDVLSTVYRALSPHTAERVEFVSLHRLASRLLDDRRQRVEVSAAGAETAFGKAWLRARPGVLGRSGLGPSYWRDEIAKLIKGRGITSFEDYEQLRRIGRRIPIDRHQRAAVWDLFLNYEEQLSKHGLVDFDDLLIRARDSILDDPLTDPYRYVIADEVQDFTLVGVQLLHALVGDAENGLTLIGDGQQSIYPGGYNLREAGISVSGRSAVLSINYRNPFEIIEAAKALVESQAFEDLDGVEEPGRRDLESVRTGGELATALAPSVAEHDLALLRAVVAAAGITAQYDGLAVLCRTRGLALNYLTVLRKAGVPVLPLEQYRGEAVGRVLVGTVKRAKGLEFDAVFLPRFDLAAETAPDPDMKGLLLNESFVAMTRSRRALWIGNIDASR